MRFLGVLQCHMVDRGGDVHIPGTVFKVLKIQRQLCPLNRLGLHQTLSGTGSVDRLNWLLCSCFSVRSQVGSPGLVSPRVPTVPQAMKKVRRYGPN